MNEATTKLRSLFEGDDLPELGPQRRPSALSLNEVEKQLQQALASVYLAASATNLVRSLLLLWHDHLDASHAISQGIRSADGSFLHGIMHRREPDFGNAAYWFRRVGDHPIYPQLAETVGRLKSVSAFKEKLIAGGRWNPLAMIDACEAVEVEAADSGDADFLREVQAFEFRLLLERFCTQ